MHTFSKTFKKLSLRYENLLSTGWQYTVSANNNAVGREGGIRLKGPTNPLRPSEVGLNNFKTKIPLGKLKFWKKKNSDVTNDPAKFENPPLKASWWDSRKHPSDKCRAAKEKHYNKQENLKFLTRQTNNT